MKAFNSNLQKWLVLPTLVTALTVGLGITDTSATPIPSDQILVKVGATILLGETVFDPVTNKNVFTGNPLKMDEAAGFGGLISDGFLFPHNALRALISMEAFLVEPGAGVGCPEPAGEGCPVRGTKSDRVRLLFNGFQHGAAQDDVYIEFTSDNQNLTDDSLIANLPDIFEDGTAQAVQFQVPMGGPLVQVEVKSCSTPCNVVPEPSTFTLIFAGGVGLLGFGWRRQRFS